MYKKNKKIFKEIKIQCDKGLLKVFDTVEALLKLANPPNIEYPFAQSSIYPFGFIVNSQSDTSELVNY